MGRDRDRDREGRGEKKKRNKREGKKDREISIGGLNQSETDY